jgi:hypothetical protein
MKQTVQSKGGEVPGTGVIVWKKKGPTEDLSETVQRIMNII